MHVDAYSLYLNTDCTDSSYNTSCITGTVSIYLSTPCIERLIVSGSGRITQTDKIQDQASILAFVSGSGTIVLNSVTVATATLQVAGSGDMYVNNQITVDPINY